MPYKKLTPMMELCDMLAIQNPLRNQMIEKERQTVIDAFKQGERMRIIKNRPDYNHEDYKINNAEQYYTQTYKS